MKNFASYKIQDILYVCYTDICRVVIYSDKCNKWILQDIIENFSKYTHFKCFNASSIVTNFN